MAFIGKKPTAAPLTSSDVADGIITNAKLAQDIISADTALGAEPADTDELLVSDAGTLKRMDYSYIKASPGWIKIGSTVTASDSSTVDFDDIASTYSMYCIMGSNIRPTTDNVSFEVNFGTDGSTYAANKTSVFAYDYGNDGDDESEAGGLSGPNTLGNSTADQVININMNNDSAEGKAGMMRAYFTEIGQGSNDGMYDIRTLVYTYNNRIFSTHVAGTILAAADCIRFTMSSGTIATGKFTLFGINQ